MQVTGPSAADKFIGKKARFEKKRIDRPAEFGVEREIIAKEIMHQPAERYMMIFVLLPTDRAKIIGFV